MTKFRTVALYCDNTCCYNYVNLNREVPSDQVIHIIQVMGWKRIKVDIPNSMSTTPKSHWNITLCPECAKVWEKNHEQADG